MFGCLSVSFIYYFILVGGQVGFADHNLSTTSRHAIRDRRIKYTCALRTERHQIRSFFFCNISAAANLTVSTSMASMRVHVSVYSTVDSVCCMCIRMTSLPGRWAILAAFGLFGNLCVRFFF